MKEKPPVRRSERAMTTSRREILRAALLAALGAAGARTLWAVDLSGSGRLKRYVILPLGDGRLLAVDREDRLKVFLCPGRRVPDGRHPLARSGAVVTERGRLVSVEGPARATGWELARDAAGTVRVRDRDGTVVMRIPAVVPAGESR